MDTPQPPARAEALNRDGLWPMPPGPPHEEKHLAQHPVVRGLVAGAADGVVLPFAVAAALAALQAPNAAVLAAGAAAAAAGAVATALGRILAARAEAEHYAAERRREEEETVEYADRERWEVAAILHRYGVRGDALRLAVDSISADKRRWVDFMMRLELDLKEPEPQRAARSAVTTAAAHGGAAAIVLAPFALLAAPGAAVGLSALLGAAALAGCGWLRGRASAVPPLRTVLQALGVGGFVAFSALVAARLAGA